MLQIRHKAIECIGCAQCVEIAPHYWRLDDEGMAKLIDKQSERDAFDFALGFDEDQAVLIDAEASCPVDIIKIQKK
ncbi:MAG: ferredoxin [Verrucomicrobiota bacterium]